MDLRTLRHEAEYYNIAPLVRRLILCEEMTQSSCGDVLFYGYLPPPNIPIQETTIHGNTQVESTGVHSARPGSIVRVPESVTNTNNSPSAHASVSNAPSNVKNKSETSDCATYTTISSFLPTTQMVNIRATGMSNENIALFI